MDCDRRDRRRGVAAAGAAASACGCRRRRRLRCSSSAWRRRPRRTRPIETDSRSDSRPRPSRPACLRGSVSTAVRMKMRSPQTIGVELPRPGRSIFHLTFFSSLHSVGGLPREAKPVPSGPRHWCQLSCCSSAPTPPHPSPSRPTTTTRPAEHRTHHGQSLHELCLAEKSRPSAQDDHACITRLARQMVRRRAVHGTKLAPRRSPSTYDGEPAARGQREKRQQQPSRRFGHADRRNPPPPGGGPTSP